MRSNSSRSNYGRARAHDTSARVGHRLVIAIEDPVYTRWKRQHPKFPGVARCVGLLGRRNVQGSRVDIICAELQANSSSHGAELIVAFRAEPDLRVRRILLGMISEARLPEALPLFAEGLSSEDEILRYWSEQGLRSLDTPESRKALWEAGRTRLEWAVELKGAAERVVPIARPGDDGDRSRTG
jgi:hypothetical protein